MKISELPEPYKALAKSRLTCKGEDSITGGFSWSCKEVDFWSKCHHAKIIGELPDLLDSMKNEVSKYPFDTLTKSLHDAKVVKSSDGSYSLITPDNFNPNEIEVGDVVRITNIDLSYCSYDKWAKTNNLKYFNRGYTPSPSMQGTVIVKGNHHVDNKPLIGVRLPLGEETREVIISIEGVKLVIKGAVRGEPEYFNFLDDSLSYAFSKEALQHSLNEIKDQQLTTQTSNKKYNGKITKVQGPTQKIQRGKRFRGITTCGKRSRASTTIGYLSNRKTSCGITC